MTPELYKHIASLASKWEGKRIVEIGARSAQGQEHMHLKPMLLGMGCSYVGIDMQAGEHVDIVGDITQMFECNDEWDIPLECADVILCLETLEHMPRFWRAVDWYFDRIDTACKELIISVPTFGFPYHAHPVDCYRFSADAAPALMPGYDIRQITYLPDGYGNQTMVIEGTR